MKVLELYEKQRVNITKGDSRQYLSGKLKTITRLAEMQYSAELAERRNDIDKAQQSHKAQEDAVLAGPSGGDSAASAIAEQGMFATADSAAANMSTAAETAAEQSTGVDGSAAVMGAQLS